VTDYEEPVLAELEEIFREALHAMARGEHAEAKGRLKCILEVEPRLPEPYLELAVLTHADGDLENALAAARLGLEFLEKGGQWLDSVPPNVLLAHAKNLVGQLLVEWAQLDEQLFDPEAFPRLYNEAVELFRSAHELDPKNRDARTNAVLHKPLPTDPKASDA
jgi:tetratricopeptide (TPR) repeat protein